MSLSEFYKTNYDLEAKRKADHTSAVSLPIGLLTVLVGAVVVMAKELHVPLNVFEQVQAAALLATTIACISCITYLVRSLYNFEYGFVPTTRQILNYYDKLVIFHSANGQPAAEAVALAERETLSYVDIEYANHADRNAQNNDVKSSLLHKATGAIIAALVAGAIAGVAHVANVISSPRQIQKFELVNAKEVPTMISIVPKNAVTSPTTPAQQPTQPIRPEPPPGRLIKEDRTPPKPPPQ